MMHEEAEELIKQTSYGRGIGTLWILAQILHSVDLEVSTVIAMPQFIMGDGTRASFARWCGNAHYSKGEDLLSQFLYD